MAKKKEITFRELLVKLEKYFKDAYILHGSCFCGGVSTEESTRGFYYGILSEDSVKMIREEFADWNGNIHIPAIKDAKDNKSTVEQINDSDIHKIEDKFDSLYKKSINIIEWRAIPLVDEDVEKIYTNGQVIDVPFALDDGTVIPLECSKSLFPGITKAHVYEIQYSLRESEEFYHLMLQYHLDKFFTIFLLYTFLK